jgi:hypothetical protein
VATRPALAASSPNASCRDYAGKQALLDDRVDAPITIDHLRDTEATPIDMSEIASVNPLVVIKKLRILRNASLSARSIEDFL